MSTAPVDRGAAPSGPALRPRSRRTRRNSFLYVSLALHGGLFVVAGYLVVSTISAPPKPIFKAGPASTHPGTEALDRKRSVVQRQITMSAPPVSKRIATNGPSRIVLPELPSLAPADEFLPSTMSTGAIATDLGEVSKLAPAGGTGGRLPNFFGDLTARKGLLKGALFDFKQTRDGQPSREDYFAVIREFHARNWAADAFRRFYSPPVGLHTAQVWIPLVDANAAPEAFDAAGRMKPSQWAVVYRGKVSPPGDGTFRFVGAADDVILVRVNGKLVMDGGRADGRYSDWKPTENVRKFLAPGGNALAFGDWIPMKAAQTYDLEILVGERPGGRFCAFLLFEQREKRYEVGANGMPELPVFRLQKVPMPEFDPATQPPFKKDGPVWVGRS